MLDAELDRHYESMCDPRLNARQSLDLAFRVAELVAGARASSGTPVRLDGARPRRDPGWPVPHAAAAVVGADGTVVGTVGDVDRGRSGWPR